MGSQLQESMQRVYTGPAKGGKPAGRNNDSSSSRNSVILLLLRVRGLLDVGRMRRTNRGDAAATAARFVLVRRESHGVFEGPHRQTSLGSSAQMVAGGRGRTEQAILRVTLLRTTKTTLHFQIKCKFCYFSKCSPKRVG
jgi:hypothetical protein